MPQPFPVNRPAFMARRYMISAGHYLAATAGQMILASGGNAIDAGVAGGLIINTVLPQWTGLGGVLPTVIYRAKDKKVFTISGLGWWPKAANVPLLKELGGGDMPPNVLRAVVPGAADAYLLALKEFGTKTFADVAAPAIELAETGFAVDPQLNKWLSGVKDTLAKWPGTAEVFLPGGEPPAVGSVLRQPAFAETLRTLCRAEAKGSTREQGLQLARDEFYRGEIARKLVEFNNSMGGLMALDDLADFSAEIEAPTTSSYGEYEVHGCGFWCQGPVVQQTLNVLEGYPLKDIGHNTADYAHLVAASLNLSFADRHAYYGDPRFIDVPGERLLSKAYAAERRGQIDMQHAFPDMAPPGDAAQLIGVSTAPRWDHDPDTSYLCVIDEEGNGFSATPSDGMTTQPIVPALGMAMSGRGRQSWLDDDHPAGIKPRKRPRLTPNPSIVTRNGELFMTFGTPGNDAQPQTMVQVFLNIVEFGMNPQQAVEAPRICSQNFPRTAHPHPYTPARLDLEPGFDPAVWDELARRGHKVQTWEHDTDTGCGCCAIVIDPKTGIRIGGADPRRDSYAIGW